MKHKQAGGQKFAGKPIYKTVYFRLRNGIVDLWETTANGSSTRNRKMLTIRLSWHLLWSCLSGQHTQTGWMDVTFNDKGKKLVHLSFNSSMTREMKAVRPSYHAPGQIYQSRVKNRLRNTQLSPPWLPPVWTLSLPWITRSSHRSLRDLCMNHRQSIAQLWSIIYGWVHTCNVTAYRNAVTLQVTQTIRSYDLNFHSVPHGVTVSCERYTLGFPVCYGVRAMSLQLAAASYIYVVGSISFRPDQLWKVTEMKQLCYFSI